LPKTPLHLIQFEKFVRGEYVGEFQVVFLNKLGIFDLAFTRSPFSIYFVYEGKAIDASIAIIAIVIIISTKVKPSCLLEAFMAFSL